MLLLSLVLGDVGGLSCKRLTLSMDARLTDDSDCCPTLQEQSSIAVGAIRILVCIAAATACNSAVYHCFSVCFTFCMFHKMPLARKLSSPLSGNTQPS